MEQHPVSQPARGAFGSQLGFVLATAGSAIGLGNIWRFPYTAGQNGGGAFLLVYLGFVAFIGIPLLLAELSIGRASQRNPVSAFSVLVPTRWWPWVGRLGVVTGFGILAFYSVIAGWTLGYLSMAVTGRFTAGLTGAQSQAIFVDFIADSGLQIGLTAGFLVLTGLIVRGGIRAGIERASKLLMPAFFLLLLVLAVRSVTLPGAEAGIEFLLRPDFSKLRPASFLNALGQALFSLSLGMGAMITYGSYLPRKQNLVTGASAVAIADTSVALAGGLMVFPALFSAGVDPAGGPGLVFVVLPTIFDALPAGTLFAVAFYVLLAIAALTSTISLLEVVVAWLVDDRRWSRERAVWTVTACALLLAIPSALSFGAHGPLSSLLGDKGGFLDLQNILFGNVSLSIGALLICLFVGWRWGTDKALAEIRASGAMPAPAVWSLLIRYVCPLAVAAVLVFLVLSGEYL